MELEKQVVSLESAKKLKELGCKQKSLFWWFIEKEIGKQESKPFVDHYYITSSGWGEPARFHYTKIASAYTVAELGELLPYRLRLDSNDYWYWQTKLKHGGVEIRWKNSMGDGVLKPIVQEDNESEARAKMLIYLYENKLISSTSS